MSDRGVRNQPSRAQWLRRLAHRRRDTVGFVLSGGGPLGALEVGALHALFETDIRPDLMVGTSVGALNATWVAYDPTPAGVERLDAVWRNLKDNDMFPGAGRFKASWARMLVRGNHVFENSGIRRLIASSLGTPRFEDLQIPLAVTATDLETGQEVVFTSGELTDPLLASTAMPSIFPPVSIRGRSYIDGGVADNVPIAPAVAMGAKTLYVFDATGHSRQRRPLNRPIDYLLHAFSLARGQRFDIERSLYAERVKLVLIPGPKLDFFVPFASMEYTDRLIDLGYEATKRFLKSGLEEASSDGIEAPGT
ncbi:MAG TPA: patatin-like phospholipase family protein [Actinomycetota bacterium]|nr:patatin-like phospholipase family protein [Actinomycetota bacterium]